MQRWCWTGWRVGGPRPPCHNDCESSFLLICILGNWTPHTHGKDQDWILGSQLWPGPTPAITGMWEVNQCTKDKSLCVGVCLNKKMKLNPLMVLLLSNKWNSTDLTCFTWLRVFTQNSCQWTLTQGVSMRTCHLKAFLTFPAFSTVSSEHCGMLRNHWTKHKIFLCPLWSFLN